MVNFICYASSKFRGRDVLLWNSLKGMYWSTVQNRFFKKYLVNQNQFFCYNFGILFYLFPFFCFKKHFLNFVKIEYLASCLPLYRMLFKIQSNRNQNNSFQSIFSIGHMPHIHKEKKYKMISKKYQISARPVFRGITFT